MDKTNDRISGFHDSVISMLTKIPCANINGTRDKKIKNIISAAFKEIEGEILVRKLDSLNIAVATGSACSSEFMELSHVLLSRGLSHEEAHSTIRISMSAETIVDEVNYLNNFLPNAVLEVREMSIMGNK